MPGLPLSLEENAIFEPPGDQEGYPSFTASSVSLLSPEPSAFIAYMSPSDALSL